MNPEALASLSPEEKKEVSALRKQFIAAVKKTNLGDGSAFARHFQIKEEAAFFVCSDGSSSLPGIKTRSRKSLEVLFDDAVANYGR
ncbi:MAG: hypothetical protein HZA32_14525 [Opitutae bacterium]|nr:hypothetical protein [Opitutae bacterium]